MTHERPQNITSPWKELLLSVGKLLLVALVGYGFAGYRQQIQQDVDIIALKHAVEGLQLEVKMMKEQHNVMIVQQATMKQQLEDLTTMHLKDRK